MRRSPLAAALVATALLAPAHPAAAQETFPNELRPHTAVGTHLRDGVRVTRFEMAVRRRDHRLRARIRVTAHNDATGLRRLELRVGRCTSGDVPHPSCPPGVTIPVAIRPGRTFAVTHDVVLRQPPPRLDAVLAALVRPQERSTHPYLDASARLLLRGRAWRGETAGEPFGVLLTPQAGVAITRGTLDGAGTSADALRASWNWDGSASMPQAVTTTLSPCAFTALDCGVRTRSTTLDIRNARVADRPSITRANASAYALRVTTATGRVLASFRLPWPA
jgi:hypothetical protein